MASEVIAKNYQITQLTDVAPTPCPCGEARRAFINDKNTVASMHIVDIKQDSELHFHKKMTELYYILEGKGHIELDGEVHSLSPGTAIIIKPGCLHRAVGSDLKILNVPIPKFDPEDEYLA